jgi:type II secretory pathway component PulJ
MNEKVARWPMIALIAASVLGLATFSVLQSEQQKAKQQAAYNQAARERAETEAVMKKLGQDAARAEAAELPPSTAEAYKRNAAAIELKRLEDDDRAATALPRSTPPR